MTRKAIQIISTYADGRGVFKPCVTLTALCDDGTIWDFDYREKKWHKILDIPQDATEEEK